MFNKRGVVSIATFSLIILILILILGFSNSFHTNSKQETILIIKEQELIYSLGNFRAELIDIITKDNNNITYQSNIDSNEIEITLSNYSISGAIIYSGQLIKTNISSLGIGFCQNYTIYPTTSNILHYNGDCISIITT